MPRLDEVDLRNEAAAAGLPVPRPTSPLDDMTARLRAMSPDQQDAFRRWVSPEYRAQQTPPADRALPPNWVEDRNAYLNAKREARQMQLEQQQRRMAEIEARRQQVAQMRAQMEATPATQFFRYGAAGVRNLQDEAKYGDARRQIASYGFNSVEEARAAFDKPRDVDEFNRARQYLDAVQAAPNAPRYQPLQGAIDIARTEIPYAQQVASGVRQGIEATAPVARVLPQTAIMQNLGERLPYVPTPTGVAGAVAESLIPTEVWQAVIELIPGVGSVPDAVRLIKSGAPDALRALDNVLGSEGAQTFIKRLQSETGSVPTGGPFGLGDDLNKIFREGDHNRVKIAELDSMNVPDSEYQNVLSTAAGRPLRKGETWRARAVRIWGEPTDTDRRALAAFRQQASQVPPQAVPKADEAAEVLPAIDTPEGAVRELNNAIRTANKLKPEQYQARSAERAKRIGEFNARVARGEDVTAAKAALGGELPKAHFDVPAIKPEVIQVMRDHIARGAWTKSGFYRINADDALAELMMGVIPADSKLARLQEAFNLTGKEGDEMVKLLMDKRSLGQQAYAEFVGAIGLPQAFMSTLDASAVFRQTGVMGAGNPREWLRSISLLKKVALSESAADEAMAAILEHPWMSGELHPGYGFLELGGRISHIGSTGEREAQFAAFNQSRISRTVEKLAPIRASERAYNLPINKIRQEVYAKYAQNMWDLGERDPDKYKALIDVIDHGTGWSNVKLGDVAKGINAFFSPRMFAARFQVLLDPIVQPGSLLKPSARQLAARNLVGFATANAALLGLLGGGGAVAAKALGIDNPIKVERDPRSTDWGKARIGNLRIDMTGGYGSILRLLLQIAPAAIGKDVKVKTGAGLVKPGDVTELTKNFLRGKLGPVPGMVWDAFVENGQSPYATDLKSKEGIRTAVYNNFVPFVVQDVVEAWRKEGPAAAGLAAPISFFGGSVNTYELSEFAKKEKGKADIQVKLKDAGFPDVEKGYTRDDWQAVFKRDFGVNAAQFKTLDDLREDYIKNVAPRLAERDGLGETQAQADASEAFSNMPSVKAFRAAQRAAELRFWRDHPELFREAVKAGAAKADSEEEKKILGID